MGFLPNEYWTHASSRGNQRGMNILRKAFAALAATEQDRALAREITAYPASASSAMVVLPASVPTTARAELTGYATVATGSLPALPQLRLQFH